MKYVIFDTQRREVEFEVTSWTASDQLFIMVWEVKKQRQ